MFIAQNFSLGVNRLEIRKNAIAYGSESFINVCLLSQINIFSKLVKENQRLILSALFYTHFVVLTCSAF